MKSRLVALTLSILVSLSLAFSAFAAPKVDKPLSFDYNGMRITLTHVTCKNKKVIAIAKEIDLKPELFSKLYAGMVSIEGKPVQMCYVVSPEDPNVILVIDENGSGGVINIAGKKEPGI